MPPSVDSNLSSRASSPPPGRLFVVIGHGNTAGDLQILAFDPATGQLTPHATAAAGSSMSFIAIHPGGRRAYTTQNRTDRVTAWKIDPATAAFERQGEAPVPGAPGAAQVGPAYVSVDPRGRFVLVANYRGHNTVVFALNPDGGVGHVVANVSGGQHAHCVVLSPDNRVAMVPNLGSDRVAQYRFDEDTGHLDPHLTPAIATAPGAGPRHLTFSPDGRRAYLLTELDATLYGYDWDAERGTLLPIWNVATLPDDYEGRRWAADIHVHPSGRALYVSNRAHDSLTVFALDRAGGPPKVEQRVSSGGQTPRNFALTPAGDFLFVANQDSGSLVTFAIDPATRRLTQIDTRAVGDAPYFVAVLALPSPGAA